MSTYFSVEVLTRREGKSGPSVVCGKPTLEEALAAGFRNASYYLLSCDCEGAEVTIEEKCARCDNEGHVMERRPRSTRQVRCPDCKGKVPTFKIGPVPVVIHENSLADLGQ